MVGERIDTEGTEHGGELPPERLAEMLEADDVELIDVRRPHEWEAGRIPGARRVEVNDLPALADELDRERPVVLYCRSGSRSELAADALRAGGFDAHALAGGISAWAEEGRPLDPEGGYVSESGEAAAVLEARRRNT
ncbi:MAG: rhodanese-like domain-containing protein [Actinomycetota bacterium]